MPLRVPDALRFASGSECELPEGALHDFMGLLRKSRGGGSRKSTLETFKEHFARCCGSSYAPSSDLSWTETDLDHYAHEASANAPAFIAAFYDACEELAHHSESAVPGFEAMNAVLASAELPYRIEGDELVCIDDIAEVLPPVPDIGPDEIVARALKDAKALIGSSGASSGVDRLHTALHGYLRRLCEDAGAKPEPTAQTGKLFKLLRQSHPALLPSGPRSRRHRQGAQRDGQCSGCTFTDTQQGNASSRQSAYWTNLKRFSRSTPSRRSFDTSRTASVGIVNLGSPSTRLERTNWPRS